MSRSVYVLTTLSCSATEIWFCRRRRSSRRSSMSRRCRGSKPNMRLIWATYIRSMLCLLLRSTLPEHLHVTLPLSLLDLQLIDEKYKIVPNVTAFLLYQFPLCFSLPVLWGNGGLRENCSSTQTAAPGQWTSETPTSQGMIFVMARVCACFNVYMRSAHA